MVETTASLYVADPGGTTTVDDIPPGGYQSHVTEGPHVPDDILLGFWLYLMSNYLIFTYPFAAYGVLGREYTGGLTGARSSKLPLAVLNTSFLLLSSITYGFAMLQLQQDRISAMRIWLAITRVFGAVSLAVELCEFAHLIHEGARPTRSAFLTSFSSLVGTHGLYVTLGLIWLIVPMVQVSRHGLIMINRHRLMRPSMSWHFLSIIRVGTFTLVYLMGALP